ncbi:hypothetical protein CBR_g17944 [Chara braunii]|uniref:ATP synthase subunit O, mitochondrial n=1 Tax=Chara braunii TaxID=69332 RepID=A0A388KWA3_CHABU|nr:hypothetical protein CBR_g17944 [Chara braunii]|eukprot:GBG74233.1 hypothetical protein CBR_g17944 [Chara braunii]
MIRSVVRSLVAGARAHAHSVGAGGSVGAKTLAPTVLSSSVPIQLFSVPGKYATSLFKAAVKADALEPVETELRTITELGESNQLVHDFLKDPSVPVRDRIAGIEDISKHLKFSPLTNNFLALLAENGRLEELNRIVGHFSDLLMAHRGEVKATITSPLELTTQEITDLKSALQARLEPGKKLLLSQKVDKSIIGGLVIELGDKMIDMSIRTKMNRLRSLLSAPLDLETANSTTGAAAE